MLRLVILFVMAGAVLSGTCPAGYRLLAGDIPGWGTFLGSRIRVQSRAVCASKCSSDPRCKSFEHSSTEHYCNLNTKAMPSSGQYKDYAFCTKGTCPAGYRLLAGDIPGWGTNLGSRISVRSRAVCAAACGAYSACKSFEHSSTEYYCNLNTKAMPSSGQYKDYAFCTKATCPPGYELLAGDIPGWGTYLGSRISVRSRAECATKCSASSRCRSFEHSGTEHYCNLNTKAMPSSGQYKDYAFCSKGY